MCLKNDRLKVLMVRQTAASLTSTGIRTFREHVAAESLARLDVVWYGGSAQEPSQFRYSNGSSIVVGGMDKPSKIMSSEYDVIYVQEATELTLDGWEALLTRLRNGRISFQQILADCNPDRPTHWLKQRCDRGECVMLFGQHSDNPILMDDGGNLTERGIAYLAVLDSLTGARKERLRYGRWVAAEGVIFNDFDPAVHLVAKPHDPPHEWRRIWTVDFGFTHPFVCQHWAINPDGVMFRYREFYGTQTLVEDWAQIILKQVTRLDGSWKEPKPEAILCDHNAEDRATLERHLKMPTQPATKTVSDGLQATQVRIRDRRLFLVSGALVARDHRLDEIGAPCCTEEEVGGYVWNDAKDQPVKEMDDGCDAMRYAVAHLDIRRELRVRWA